MKRNPSRPTRANRRTALLLVTVLSASVQMASSNVNEKKVLREASGVYKGTVTGGNFVVTYDDGSPGFNFTGPAVDYKERATIKAGRLSRSFTDDNLPGDGTADAAGTQKPKVTRGGKRITLKVVNGILDEDDGDNKGPWTGGKANGTLDDKGRVWSAKSTASAKQRNSTVTGDPPDHTRSVTGRKISGKD